MAKPHESSEIVTQTAAVPAWLLAMRQAARDAIKPEDIQEIVQNRIKKAKEGDAAAIEFIFKTVLGGDQLKGLTLIQHNHAAPIASAAVPEGDPEIRQVLTLLETYGVATVDQLAKDSGLAKPTVDRCLRRLTEDRMVKWAGGKWQLCK